jgi:hypothetical protein
MTENHDAPAHAHVHLVDGGSASAREQAATRRSRHVERDPARAARSDGSRATQLRVHVRRHGQAPQYLFWPHNAEAGSASVGRTPVEPPSGRAATHGGTDQPSVSSLSSSHRLLSLVGAWMGLAAGVVSIVAPLQDEPEHASGSRVSAARRRVRGSQLPRPPRSHHSTADRSHVHRPSAPSTIRLYCVARSACARDRRRSEPRRDEAGVSVRTVPLQSRGVARAVADTA